MSISIEIFPASYGDCFLIQLENETTFNILIDGGMIYGNPNKDKLINRLKELHKDNHVIDLLIVTHIDDDHIQGIINLLENNENDAIISIKEIWFNGFKHIRQFKEATEKLSEEEQEKLETIFQNLISTNNMGMNRVSATTAKNALTQLILDRKIEWNKTFGGKPIIMLKNVVTNKPQKYNLRKDISIQILTPTNEILVKLDEKWLTKLGKDYREKEDALLTKTVEFLFAQMQEQIYSNETERVSDEGKSIDYYLKIKDKEAITINNQSSISFILEFEGKRLLFLGDAVSSDVLESVGNDSKQHFNLIKVSHHGSKAYTTKPLLEIIDADYFIISTDGGNQGKHPNMECIAKIVGRETDKKRTLVFNYTTHKVYSIMQNKEWQSTYKYEIYPIINNNINVVKL